MSNFTFSTEIYKSLFILKFQEAISCLNSLQSNASVIERRKSNPSQRYDNVPATSKYLSRVGVLPEDLNKLSVIHVAGLIH